MSGRSQTLGVVLPWHYLHGVSTGQMAGALSALVGELQYRNLSPAVVDGALGFCAAMAELFPKTATQRCWVHKTRNVLIYLAKVMQARAKTAWLQIWMAPSRAAALQAVEIFVRMYGAKYPRAVASLKMDLDKLLTFYNFPAEHWVSLRTTNPI